MRRSGIFAAVIALVILLLGGVFLRQPVSCWLHLRNLSGRQIAFLRDGAVYIMDADGSNQCEILGGSNHVALVWSPDGKQLAVVSEKSNLEDRLTILNRDGSGARELTSPLSPASRDGLAWSPDGKQIAYLGSTANVPIGQLDYSRLDVVDVASGTESEVTKIPGEALDLFNWSPDGHYLAFANEHDVYAVDMTNRTPNNGTSGTVTPKRLSFSKIVLPVSAFVWSPDSQHIIVPTDSTTGTLQLINVDGTQEKTFPFNVTEASNAKWMSYITKLAWTNKLVAVSIQVLHGTPSGKDETWIAVLNTDTGEVRKLASFKAGYSSALQWIDNGTLLYSYNDLDKSRQIIRIDATNGAQQVLASGGYAAFAPGN